MSCQDCRNIPPLSSEALQQTSSSFLEIAKLQISGHVAPLKESLERMDRQMSGLEQVRQEAYGAVTQQLTTLNTTQERLRLETGNLVKALRTPHVRGRWGEVQLRNVVEAAGMLPHCDFQEQASTRDGDGALLRPDLVVRIPGGKHVVVDAKAPLAAYLDACESDDDAVRAQHLAAHARQVRDHLGKLAQKAYWRQFEPSPDFVIMFVPDETFIRAAQEHDAALSEDGWRHGVILASPSTLFTLLRTVAATWQQETVAQSAREVHELGRELYTRIATMAKHLSDAGKALDNAVGHYNAAIGSLETRVLVQARRFEQHGIEGEIRSPQHIERTTRPLQAAELVEPDEQLRAIDAA